MNGRASSRRSLLLLASAAGCRAFSPCSYSSSRIVARHHLGGGVRRRPRRSRGRWTGVTVGNANEDDGTFPETVGVSADSSERRADIRSAFAVAVSSVVVSGVAAFAFGCAEAADALDNPFNTLIQRKEVGTALSARSSIEGSFQSLWGRGATSKRTRATNMKTLLSSAAQSAPAKIIDNPQVTQQIMIPNPIAPEGKGQPSQTPPKQTMSTDNPAPAPQTPKKAEAQTELQATDIKRIAEENTIDVELICKDGQRPLDPTPPVIKVDRETFTKVKVYQPPFLRYLPSSVQPLVSRQFRSLQVLKSIPNDQLFVASVFAGSITEMVRTLVTYPLSTVKARVQARTSRSTNRRRPVLRKLRVTWLTFWYETKRGDWYAGLLPSLLITVPASGVYSGAKEVSRRAFSMAIQFQVFQNLFPGDAATSSYYSALVVNLLAAFVADVASLAIRTPADVLALRLQVFGNNNVKSDYTDWAKDSVALLPAMLITDIPFLLSRIFLNAAITTSGENLGRYEFETITIACLCAFLTTPFDVARTRILLPTLPSEEEEDETQSQNSKRRRLVASSKDRERRRQKLSVALTMKKIAAEGNGGVQNLYAGWLERTAYLGLGRAWLDPLRVIGYLGIRDALLLKLFD